MKYLLLIMSSTLIISCFNNDTEWDRVDVSLSESQWEYLDLNGYWIFKDIYNDIDTVYVNSIMEVDRGRVYGPPTFVYTERITLNIGESRLIQVDSNCIFTTRGYISEPFFNKTNRNSNIYFGPIYLNDIWELTEEDYLEIILEAEINEEDTIFLTTNNEDLWRLNYTLVRGIGLTKYEIILNGDSTYSSSLIDYQIERNYKD